MKMCNGYKGKENRVKGDRVKLTVGDYLKVIMFLCGLIGSLVLWGIYIDGAVDKAEENITEVKTEVSNNSKANAEQNTDIEVVQNDIQTIKEDVEEIKTGQQENQKLLYKIWGKLDE